MTDALLLMLLWITFLNYRLNFLKNLNPLQDDSYELYKILRKEAYRLLLIPLAIIAVLYPELLTIFERINRIFKEIVELFSRFL